MEKFGSDESTGKLFDFYVNQVNLILELSTNPDFKNTTGRMSELYVLFYSLHSIGFAIAHLAQHGFLNESFMLARSQLEKTINYLYLLNCDEEEYLNYVAYTKQKQFRMFNRSVNVGEMKAKINRLGVEELKENPELQEALNKFTSKSGKEISRWSTKSIPDRLSVIEPKLGKDIGFYMLSYLGIHENASEALHGTIYGVAFNIGLWGGKPPSSVDELYENWNGQFSMLFLMLGTYALLKAIHNEVPIESIKAESSENVKAIEKYRPSKAK